MSSLICRTNYAIWRRFISSSRNLQGYIVLVPEIGEDSNAANALINSDGLPQFNGVTIENCLAAIAKQANDVEEVIKDIEKLISTSERFDVKENIFNRLECITSALETTWGIAKTLYLGNSSLMPTKSYMNIHEKARGCRASKFNNDLIYKEIKNYVNKNDIDNEEKEHKRLIQKYLLEGKLNGLELPQDKKDELSEILRHLGQERTSFKKKVDTSINQFKHVISNYSLVRDFPPSILESIAIDRNNPTKGPWKVTLQPQIAQGFLKYCPDRNERWNIWQADVRKASGLGEKSLENSTHIENIRSLRKRQAVILGFPNYAAMSMQTKMVGNIENIKTMFSVLLKYAGPAQLKEIENLQDFALKSGFKEKLHIYDILYWQRKQLKAEFNLDEEVVREYFPLPNVVKNLFPIAETLLGIKFVEKKNVDVWNPNVKYYDIYNEGEEDPIAGIYLDFYCREGRLAGNTGWMVGIRNRSERANAKPLSALIFNFNAPIYGKPYLLTIDDLLMVFKNFGTALQHSLTQAKYSDLAGLSNIEWDSSQICGHVFSNILSKSDILKNISGHYSTGELIGSDILNNIKKIHTHMAGYKLCKELYMADLDLELYSCDDFWLEIVKKLWPLYMCMPLDKKDSHPCSMVDIFAGDWSAAYYSHLYSKILAADISNAFLEDESNIQEIGRRFKKSFLAYGGSISTAEIFRIFRGRDPSPNAFLESLELIDSKKTCYY